MGHVESKPKENTVQYDVTIQTGNHKHSEKSDSHTFIILYGDKGVSESHRLHHGSRDDFKKGHTDTHPIYEKDLGNLWKIEIWKNDKNDKPGHWYINKIDVKLKLVPDSPGRKLKVADIKRGYESKKEISLTGSGELRSESNNDRTQISLARSAPSTRSLSRNKLEGGFDLKKSSEETRRVSWTFPCYRWIDEHEELFEGTSMLPQYETNRERATQRKDETEKKKGIYQWKCMDGLPQYIRCTFDTLPFDERWNEEKLHDFQGSRMKVATNFGLDKLFGLFHSWKDFDDYKDLFNLIPIPKIQKNWKEDETFGRMRIWGVNPCNIQRVVEWPIKNFPVTDEHVKGLLRPGKTLADEVKDNRIYMIDFSWYNEYDKPENLKEGRYVASPMTLLYVNGEEKLLPIAIQLRTTTPYDAKQCPILTPLDNEAEWLLAKMFVCNCEGVHHQLKEHLLATHLITEPMVIAMHRNLSSCHPIYKLLLPHFKYQLAINCRAREFLINEGGPIDEILPFKFSVTMEIVFKSFDMWRFEEANPVAHIQKRNITLNPKELPGFYYRDDGLVLWDAITSWVKDIVDIFYKDNNDVINDFELLNFTKEIVDIGFHGDSKGFPSKIEDKATLVHTISTIIWIVSCQHAVLNFVQYECYGWIPAQPASLHIAPMGHPDAQSRTKTTFEDIFKALPLKGNCSKQIALAYVLSQYSREDQMLGQYPESYFIEDSVSVALEEYKNKLNALEQTIDKRGDWDHLHPKKIPNATAV